MRIPVLDSIASAHSTIQRQGFASSLQRQLGDPVSPVFATSQLVELMEMAAARLLYPYLEQGEYSVGVSIDIVNAVTTLSAATAAATARYVARDGALYVFEVFAVDTHGEIGRGTHTRTIVSSDDLREDPAGAGI
ncbi:MAG: thioesterase family protein [Thermoanaerobaculia bacterium]